MAEQVVVDKGSVLMRKLMRRVNQYLTDLNNAGSRSTNVFGVWTKNKKDVERDFTTDLKGFTKVAIMLGNQEVLSMCQMQAKQAKESLIDDLNEILDATIEDGD